MLAKYRKKSQVQDNYCFKSHNIHVNNTPVIFELKVFRATCEVLVQELRFYPINTSESTKKTNCFQLVDQNLEKEKITTLERVFLV